MKTIQPVCAALMMMFAMARAGDTVGNVGNVLIDYNGYFAFKLTSGAWYEMGYNKAKSAMVYAMVLAAVKTSRPVSINFAPCAPPSTGNCIQTLTLN